MIIVIQLNSSLADEKLKEKEAELTIKFGYKVILLQPNMVLSTMQIIRT